MESHDPYHLQLGSDRFLFLCTKLNATVRRDGAAWSVDILSGGFKFNDEIPDGLGESPDLYLPLVTLLRGLWAYRRSLVEGRPRPDLAPTWEWTRRLAPQWAGFAPDRCSARMQPVVEELKARDAQFGRGIEGLEARVRRSGDAEKNGAHDGDVVSAERRPIETN